jgi:hypothetical protein
MVLSVTAYMYVTDPEPKTIMQTLTQYSHAIKRAMRNHMKMPQAPLVILEVKDGDTEWLSAVLVRSFLRCVKSYYALVRVTHSAWHSAVVVRPC